MTRCLTDNLIFARIRWGCELRARRSTGLYLNFPIYVGDILIIERIACSCTKLHDDKVMHHGAIVCSIDGYLFACWDNELTGLKLKICHYYINCRCRGLATTA